MIKSWADHCSSDDEDDLMERERLMDEEEEAAAAAAGHPEPDANASSPYDDEAAPELVPHHEGAEGDALDGSADQQEDHAEDQHHHKPREPRPPKTYDFPTEPPFTAFVGNLSYNIAKPEDLVHELTEIVAQANLDCEISFVHGRIAMDKRSGDAPKHRGFGYVTVETLDQLKALMELNNKHELTLAGRKIQIDTTTARNNNNNSHNNNRQNRSSDNIDGSRFRGGRFANKDNNRRDGGRGGGNDFGSGATGGDPAAQRPSLKLAPRTKPVAENGEKSGNPASDIFGGAKPRDASEWQSRRNHPERDTTQAGASNRNTNRDIHANKDNNSSAKEHGSGGRGGRGSHAARGSGGRGGEGFGSGRSGASSEGRGGRGGRGPGGRGRGGELAGGRDSNNNHSSGRNFKAGGSGDKTPDAGEGGKQRRNPVAIPKPAEAGPEKAPSAPKVVNKFAVLNMDDSDSD